MNNAREFKKSCILGAISGITVKCNTEQTLVCSNQASFPMAETKNKKKNCGTLKNTLCKVRILC